MNQTDKRILAILEKNARTSATEIGRQIGLSRTAVQGRITKLETSAAIVGYHAQISPAHDHLIRAVLFVKIAIRPCEQALNWMATLEGVQEVVSLAGDLDAIVKCTLVNVSALTALNDKIGASDLIMCSNSNVVLRQIR